MKKYLIVAVGIALLSGCVPNKVLKQSQLQTQALRADSTSLANKITQLQGELTVLNGKITSLNNQNSQLGQQTADQQNKLGQSQQTLEQQQKKLQQLQALLSQQKKQSELLKNKMAEALKGFNSNDLTVVQKNGKVYVSLSENLLFPSGSAVVNKNWVDALS